MSVCVCVFVLCVCVGVGVLVAYQRHAPNATEYRGKRVCVCGCVSVCVRLCMCGCFCVLFCFVLLPQQTHILQHEADGWPG